MNDTQWAAKETRAADPKSETGSGSGDLNRIVNLYKKEGPTSFDMVQAVKRVLKVKKAGHIGTLDPLAEGVLPICLNRSTRIIQFLSALPKSYRTRMVLGTATDTQDASGKVTATGETGGITEAAVRSVLAGFTGPQKQVPPMFSAKKRKGIPLYKLARNGITIERKPANITIFAIEFIKKEGDRVEFEVHCSAGTYIRTLCHDIGQALGSQAHMEHLVRTRVGEFDLAGSVTLDALEAAVSNGSLSQKLVPQEKALQFLPEIRIKKDFSGSVAHGVAPSKSCLETETVPGTFHPGMNLRLANGNHRLLAIVEPVVDQDAFTQLGPNAVPFKLKRVLV